MTKKKDLKKLSRKELEQAFIYNEREYLRRIDKLTGNLSLLNDNFTKEVVKNAKLVEENKLRIKDQQLAIEDNKRLKGTLESMGKSYEDCLKAQQKEIDELKYRLENRNETPVNTTEEEEYIKENNELKAQIENIKIGMSIADRTLEGLGELCVMNQNLICENSNLKEQANVDAKTIASLEEDKAELTMEKEQMYLNNKSISEYNSNLETALNKANRDLKEYRDKNINLHGIIDVIRQCDRTTVRGFDSIKSDNDFLKLLSTAFGLSTLLLLVLYFIATNG